MKNRATCTPILLAVMILSLSAGGYSTALQQQDIFTTDSTDINLITTYLRDQYGAISVSENEDPSKELDLLWESGPYKIENEETLKAFEKGYRFYAVCSAVHGIPGPSFRMVLMINPDNQITPVKYDDHTIFNQCLRKKRSAHDLKTFSAAVMTVLSNQYCMQVMAHQNDIKVTKKSGKYDCQVRKGTGHRKKGAAYSWTVEFDNNLNCIKATFSADLPPVP